MKRSDQHVSLYTPSLSTPSKFRETKKLRKRRELNAMVAPRHVVIGRSKRRHLLATSSSGAAVQSQYFDSADDSSSENNNDDEDEDDQDYDNDKGVGHAYINLTQKSHKLRQKGGSGSGRCWNTRNHKFFGLCRGLCLCFIILNGFFVLVALTWLHFSLRAQTQEMNTQLHQGVFFF